jgi:uncharacterized membrane protein HdeD (DUF308 family)
MQRDYFLMQMSRQWHWIVIRGLAAIVLSLLAFVLPVQTLEILALCWGAYALVDGLITLVTAYQIREQNRPWWSLAIVGVLGVAAGLVTFAWPGVTAATLVLLVALWSLAMGIFQIVAALRVRKSMRGEWMLILSGAVSVLFGAAMLLDPAAGAVALVWLTACYVMVFGVLLLFMGLRLRSVAHEPWEPPVVTRPSPLGEPHLDR